jgi:predicted PurR-regulated permease PerM
MFAMCVAQLGAVPVLLLATGWAYYSEAASGWVLFLLGWTVLVGGIDNIIRPLLIRRGANLPLLLIFAGVIGGLLAFGIIGLFVGPVCLAVAYTLLDRWVKAEGLPASSSASSANQGVPETQS